MTKNHDFKELVDRNLSGLNWNEQNRRKVFSAINEEERPVKKVSTTLILIAAILCISFSALAAGVLFSEKYEVRNVARKAMESRYGITEDLLALFTSKIEEQENGAVTIEYSAPDEGFPAERMGKYTVLVKGNEASVSWSNDGMSSEGGLKAEAYGREQLQMLLHDYEAAMQELREMGVVSGKSEAAPNPRLTGEIIWTDEDQAEADRIMKEEKAAEEQRQGEIANAEASGHYTMQDAVRISQKAIAEAYGLNQVQLDRITYEPDSTVIVYDEGIPQANLLFWLWQRDDQQFTEKDGQYWVLFNMDTGLVENILYDTGLAGNG